MAITEPIPKPQREQAQAYQNDPRWQRYLDQKKYYITGTIFVWAIIALFILYPGVNNYQQALAEIDSIQEQIQGVPGTPQKGLRSQKDQLVKELLKTQEEMKQKNRDLITKIYKAFPSPEDDKVLTNIVRLFESIAYSWHSPQTQQPIVIKGISFGDPELEGQIKRVPIQLSLSGSELNVRQFLYMIETSGIFDKKDVFDAEMLRSLEGILSQDEINAVYAVIESEFEIQDLLNLSRSFSQDPVKKRLIDRFLAKPTLYKKYEAQVDPRYYPAPLFSVDALNYSIDQDTDDLEKIQNEGVVQFTAQLSVYMQNQNLLQNVLQ